MPIAINKIPASQIGIECQISHSNGSPQLISLLRFAINVFPKSLNPCAIAKYPTPKQNKTNAKSPSSNSSVKGIKRFNLFFLN